jgi:hypothetical protein
MSSAVLAARLVDVVVLEPHGELTLSGVSPCTPAGPKASCRCSVAGSSAWWNYWRARPLDFRTFGGVAVAGSTRDTLAGDA